MATRAMTGTSTAAVIHAPIATALEGLATVADIGGYESVMRVAPERASRHSMFETSGLAGLCLPPADQSVTSGRGGRVLLPSGLTFGRRADLGDHGGIRTQLPELSLDPVRERDSDRNRVTVDRPEPQPYAVRLGVGLEEHRTSFQGASGGFE